MPVQGNSLGADKFFEKKWDNCKIFTVVPLSVYCKVSGKICRRHILPDQKAAFVGRAGQPGAGGSSFPGENDLPRNMKYAILIHVTEA